MRIGIDARLIRQTGVGRYIRNLIRVLSDIDTTNEYTIFLMRHDYEGFIPPNRRWSKVLTDVKWHSITEQFVMPWFFLKARLDLLHVPYFNVPILYPGPYIVTIHDLTILHHATGKASTLPWFLYAIRRFGYQMVLRIGILRARDVVTVSKTVKNDIISVFHKPDRQVHVTYEGIDPVFLDRTHPDDPKTFPVQDAYFLYVGNVYPHKNIEALLSAYDIYIQKTPNPAKLVFVGPDDYFYRKLKVIIESLNMQKNVVFFHNSSDHFLRLLYSKAQALLFPSLMEGFGLPAIEAIVQGCPVVCSDIPIFREIVSPYGTFVDTTKPKDIADILSGVVHKKKNSLTDAQYHDFVSRFDWGNMGKHTMKLYTGDWK